MFIIRGHDDGRDGAVDVDPEVVRKGVRNLMQQVAQIERERVSVSTRWETNEWLNRFYFRTTTKHKWRP
jgi:hypothetical protein